MVVFSPGNFQNYYSNPAIRKTPQTISLMEKCLAIILDLGWETPPKASWLLSVKSQQYYENFSIALNELKHKKKGSFFVNLTDPKTQDTVFVRWYSNSPQQDVLSVESSYAIVQGYLIESTPIKRAKEIAKIFEVTFEGILKEHTRPLDASFIRLQKLTFLSENLPKPFPRVHPKAKEDSK
ncbi:MAG: hypothetical protein ACW976_02890 [Candidatus Ranarchaeia archaeon]|jgi:hypothetical protein